MRFVVLGSGAIGGMIGGRLFQYGHEVVLVARGAHYETIVKDGLCLESADETVQLAVPVVSDLKAIGFRDDDVVLLAVKSHDTAGAVEELAGAAFPGVPVVCMQNGVENERIALRRFSNVYGACVVTAATYLVPGRIQIHFTPVAALLDLGRWPQGTDDRASAIASELSASSFISEVRADIARFKWGKLMRNLGNATEALWGFDARNSELTVRAREEAAACLQAAGIAYIEDDEMVSRWTRLLTRQPGNVAQNGGSTWQSLLRSSGAIESDYLNGEIALLGRIYGVATPVNDLVNRLSNKLARDRGAPGSVPEATVRSLLDAGG